MWNNLIISLPCSLKKPYQNGKFKHQQKQTQNRKNEQLSHERWPCPAVGLDEDNEGGNMEYGLITRIYLVIGRIQEG